jgi:CheY-like chemotaxis protein
MPHRKKKRILVVDDEEFIRHLAAHWFSDFELETASNGAEALNLMKVLAGEGKSIDLVLTDENMPVLGGPHFLKDARKAGYTMPFIIFGGYINAENKAEFLELGFAAALGKPITDYRNTLIPVVKYALGMPTE